MQACMRYEEAYPSEKLWSLWQIVLLNQFHDILPGSSIGAVYDDSDRDYARFFAEAEVLKLELGGGLAGRGQHFLFNAIATPRTGLVALPQGVTGLVDGSTEVAAQRIVRADGTTLYVAPVTDVAALGGRSVVLLADGPEAAGESELSVSATHLENALLRVELDGRGRIVSLTDKRNGREAIEPGRAANALFAHQDIPLDFDAWDIDASFEDKVWPVDNLLSAEVVETGPYRAALRLNWRYEHSTITQVLALEAGSARLDIDCFADWHEHQTLLKAAFPLAIRSDSVTAEIQFGHVARPTHRNTSWDQARFETPMHRWVDFSEADFGVALLNDCKYGYDAHAKVLRLTLIKSPVFPWPEADQGEHRFRYALFLHAGDLQAVHDEAEAFNLPLRLVEGSADALSTPLSLVEIVGQGVSVEAVKRAEDSDAIVLRLWETQGRRQSVTLRFAERWQVREANLLEQPLTTLAGNTDALDLSFAPFQIRTLLLEQ